MSKPTLTATNHPLHFGDLSPDHFERLCLWLVSADQRYERAEHYGAKGGDKGRDVIAYEPADGGARLWYFQCKRYKELGPQPLKTEVDKVLGYVAAKEIEQPFGFVFVTSADAAANTRDELKAYCQQHALAREFWGGMNSITLELPETLQVQLELLARREGVSLSQYLVYAITRQVSLDYQLEKVALEVQQAERERFAALRQSLGTASESELDAALAEREVVEPEAELTLEVIARLQERKPLRPHNEVVAEIWARQKARGHLPCTREEIDAALQVERDSWDDRR